MLVFQIDRRSLDKHLLDLSARFQRIAVGHNQVRPLAFLDGTKLIAGAPDLGWI